MEEGEEVTRVLLRCLVIEFEEVSMEYNERLEKKRGKLDDEKS